MWEAFLTAHQETTTSESSLFHSLGEIGIEAVSPAAQRSVMQAWHAWQQSQSQAFTRVPFARVLKQIHQPIQDATLKNTLPNLKPLVKLNDAAKANLAAYQRLNDPNFWSSQLQAVRHDPTTYQKLCALKKEWRQSNHYALYPTQGLVWIYATVFPVLQNWLVYAYQELHLKRAKLRSEFITIL